MILVFDTETTGKADFKKSPIDPCQPKLVQLGAILYDDQFNVRSELNVIIYPEGYTIPEEASDVHGITTDIAKQCGIPCELALKVFQALSLNATIKVAHNIKFDNIVLAANNHRYGIATNAIIDYCTMETMTNICQLPGFYGKYKWPTLQEAYTHCFNKSFDGAHDAMADVKACAEVYKWLQKNY